MLASKGNSALQGRSSRPTREIPAVRHISRRLSISGAAVELARNGEGPSLIEAVTARLVGHYIGDAQLYRPPGELERAKQDEPIERVRRRLLTAPKEVAALEKEVDEEVQLAYERARAGTLADPLTVREFIYD